MSYLTKKKFTKIVLAYSGFALICVFAGLILGTEKFTLTQVLKGLTGTLDGVKAKLFNYQRLPRVITGFIAGGTFSLTGFCYQNVFRNSLATPFTTGITSGGTLGAVIAISFTSIHFDYGFISTLQIFSLLGSLTVLLIIYSLSLRKKQNTGSTILLTGISISILISSVVLLIRYLLNPNILVVVDRWMMGGLSVNGFNSIAGIFPLLIPGLMLLFWQSYKLNYLVSGTEMALSRGIDAGFVTRTVLIGGTFATASVVSVTGPITFVGLIVPHIIKRISGYDARISSAATFLAGAGFLVVCDALARIIISPSEMPVGIITALLGGVYFIYLINVRKR